MKRESKFQKELINDLRDLFPGSIILMNDANYLQGVSDLTILYKEFWALLEVKRSEKEPRQPNQEYYIGLAQEWSYGAIVYPENKEEILNELQLAFQPRRPTRVSKRK